MLEKFIKSIIITAAIGLSGCAAFQANNLPDLSNVDRIVPVSTKTRIFSRWDFNTSKSEEIRAATAAIHKKDFEKAILASGCCEVVESLSDASLVISGEVMDHSSSAVLIPAVITGISLYTIPSWVTEKIDITVLAESGNKSLNYELEDSFKLVQWLPMAFAFPFTGGPIKNSERLRENTYNNLVYRLREDGFI